MNHTDKPLASHLPSDQTYIFLVNDQDQSQGLCEKLWAHKIGALHRAVSVYLTSKTSDNVLLQKRSAIKYHSPGRWSNAACTHTLDGETPEQAARRALHVELGLHVDHLQYLGYFIYKTAVGDDLIEHELDHVFMGQIDESTTIPFAPEEVEGIQWMSADKLKQNHTNEPEKFSYWFPYLMRYINAPQSGTDFRE